MKSDLALSGSVCVHCTHFYCHASTSFDPILGLTDVTGTWYRLPWYTLFYFVLAMLV